MSYKKKLCIIPEGIRTIAPEENCPPVKVRVWVRVRVSFRVGGGEAIFLGGNCPRTIPEKIVISIVEFTVKNKLIKLLT